MRAVSSWGRLNAFPHSPVELTDTKKVAAQMAVSAPGIPFGMGRSYGDVCLHPGGTIWMSSGMDHYLRFDAEAGVVVCEAGVLLRDIQRLSVSRGWMLPVTPGTQIVTVGGAIANDVHGKNHHRFGSFGNHVRRLRLQRSDGTVIDCGPEGNKEWLAATVGGLGLTGIILEAELQLRPVAGPWLETETLAFGTLNEFFQISDASEADWEQGVAWIDCTRGNVGRGLFSRANPLPQVIEKSQPEKRSRLSIPMTPPFSLVNGLSLRSFNNLYYTMGKRKHAMRRVEHYEPFLYPLDNIQQWNRMYGPKGFYQYQSVVPHDGAEAVTQSMLEEIASSGNGSFLAVLKTFGSRPSIGMLSFPRPGVTLALDFRNGGQATERLFQRLDAIVGEAGGAIYAAKDARMPRWLFEAGYPRLGEFANYRDPGIRSGFSRRLMGN